MLLRVLIGEECGDEVEAVSNPSRKIKDVCVY